MISKNTRPAVVITGATGILGSAVLAEALTRGYHPIAIMRDGSLEDAEARLRAVLSVYGLQHLACEVSVAQGDVRRFWLGMDPRTAAAVLGCARAFIHCAASTSFDPKCNQDVWNANVGGAENMVEFLARRGVPLYHVSTAYVAGAHSGLAFENELQDTHGFTNGYERSKWYAERLVRHAMERGDIRGAIFRPGIIIGSASDGAITDFQNFYGFLRLVHLAKSRMNTQTDAIRLEGDESTPCNFVPVDWTAKALWHIIENEGACNRTYHLTDPTGMRLGDMLGWVNGHLVDSGIRFELVRELEGTVCALENMARVALQHYRPYAFRQPQFNMTNTLQATEAHLPIPTFHPDMFDRIYEFAQARRWKGALTSMRTRTRNADMEMRALRAEALPA